MLRWLMETGGESSNQPRNPPSERKLRLFACACCRLAGKNVLPEWEISGGPTFAQAIDWAYHWCMAAMPSMDVKAGLIRDIIGNPFRTLPLLTRTVYCDRCNGKGQRTPGKKCGTCDGSGKTFGNADWLDWNGGTIRAMASGIYEGRRFDDMPILADALEDAGCVNEDVLMHCRGMERSIATCRGCGGDGLSTGPPECRPCRRCDNGEIVTWAPIRGPHVRGCWVLDLILGKE